MNKIVFILIFLCCFPISMSFSQDDIPVDGAYADAEEKIDVLDEEINEDLPVDDAYVEEEIDETTPAQSVPAPKESSTANVGASTLDEQDVYIPLFSSIKPRNTVDPAVPSLPADHALLRLKGTIWCNNDPILFTNALGVVAEHYMYLVFSGSRDAVAFAIAPYNTTSTATMSQFSSYIPLNPVLETNTYRVNPYESSYIEIPEKYRRPTPSALVNPAVSPPIDTPVDKGLPPAVTSATQDDNIAELPIDAALSEEVPLDEEQPPALIETEEDDTYDEEYSEDTGEEELLDEEPLEEQAEDDAYSFRMPLSQPYKMVGQNIVPSAGQSAAPTAPLTTTAVVNVGGLNSGIFVYENLNNTITPYTVLFLSLEKDNVLYAYVIQNSFDIRVDSSPAIADARELYKKALNTKANMKRFVLVQDAEDDVPEALRSFFK